MLVFKILEIMCIFIQNYVHIAVLLRGDRPEAKIPEDVAVKTGKLKASFFIR